MKVTVCQLPERQDARASAFQALTAHVRQHKSDFLLLPEMPFHSWLARTNQVDRQQWLAAVKAHQEMIPSFCQFGDLIVAGTQPILESETPYNEAFVWDKINGARPAHKKYYLPEEAEFWEASWYRRGPKQFDTMASRVGNVGFLICTELWFTDWARKYAREDVHLLLSPRASAGYSKDKWLAGGRAAAVMAGAFSLSSNRGGVDEAGLAWAGCGWVISPEGDILGTTTADQPFLTLEIDLEEAIAAKKTYPRYVPE